MDDPTGAIVLWFLTVFACALALPFVVAALVILCLARGLMVVGAAGYGLVRGKRYERELRQTNRTRNEAILAITRLQRQAEGQMRELVKRPAARREIERRRR